MTRLGQRLADGETILIDGGTGTELERLGVPMTEGAWCGDAARTHPDAHVQVHRSHIEAGADLVIANTYASSRHLLAAVGLDDHFATINRTAVELARAACDEAGRPDVVVAGSMSTTAQGGDHPPIEVARANFADQAEILAEAGADLLILEMMRDVEQTMACLEGAEATGLPIWLGWSVRPSDDGTPMLWDLGATLRDGVHATLDRRIEAMMIMHSEVEHVDAGLDVLDELWTGPVGVYAHSGEFRPPTWVFTDVISERDYADWCLGWIDRGVRIIGGCCGITCDHIAVLASAMDGRDGV